MKFATVTRSFNFFLKNLFLKKNYHSKIQEKDVISDNNVNSNIRNFDTMGKNKMFMMSHNSLGNNYVIGLTFL